MSVASELLALATRLGQEVKALKSGKADTAHNHAAGDVISGTVAFARLPVGSTASTVAAGNDPRLSDARTPTAHNHGAADITSGALSVERLPTVTWNTVTAATTSTASWTLTADSTSGPRSIDITCNHDSGIAVPTGGSNHQVIRITAWANNEQRTFTFASGYRLSTGLSSRTFTIPPWQVLLAAIEYSNMIGAWVITAATVSAS